MTLESDVDTIYQTYPRHVGRRKALLEIERALRRLQDGENGPRMNYDDAVNELLKTTALFARSPAGHKGEFCPHPTSWFHQSRYLDDPKEWLRLDDESVSAPPVSNAPWEKYKAEQKRAAEQGKMATEEDYALMRGKLRELFGDPNHKFPAKA